jgi:hypothetical protein
MRLARIQFSLPQCPLSFDCGCDGTFYSGLIDSLNAAVPISKGFDLPFELYDPSPRLAEIPDLFLSLLGQMGKLGQHATNRRRWCRR